MAKQIQLRRGTTTESTAFIGAVGELTYDTEKKQLRVHDGSTTGGKVVDDPTRDVTSQVSNATETEAGKAKIATTSIAQAGVNDTDIITAKKLANTRKSVWSNKTDMLFDTTYVNSSLFDRDLSVISQTMSQGYVTIRCVFIDLITLVETTVFFGAHANYSNVTIASAVFTIPAQTSYKISVVDTISDVTRTATVLRWAERDYA